MRFKDDTFTCSGCGDTFGLDTHSYYYKVGRRVYCPECMAADYHDKYDEEVEEDDGALLWRGMEFNERVELEEYWIKEFEPDAKTVWLWTAEEREADYGDMKYDEWKDEQYGRYA